MDDRLRETLSAMMDDEADELSVRRLLSHPGQGEVREQWQRWQQVRDLMHESQVTGQAGDISERVRRTLQGHSVAVSQPAPEPGPARRWHWPAVASLGLALLVGFGVGNGLDEGSSPTVAAENGVEVRAGGSTSQSVPEVAIQGLDEEQWEHMSRYLLEHAQHNSVAAGRGSVGYARVVSASGAGY